MKSPIGDKTAAFGIRDFLLLAFLGLFLVAVQSSLIAWAGFASLYYPEWVLVLTIYIILRTDLWLAVLGAFVLGFIRDALGGGVLGLYQFTLVLLTWLFHPFRSRLNFFNPLTLMPLTFILSFGGYLFVMTPVMAVLGWPGNTFNPVPAFFISSLTTALTAPVLFYFLDWLTRRKTGVGRS